jgi:hypothetical protein
MNALLERIAIDPEVCGGKPCIKAPASGFRSRRQSMHSSRRTLTTPLRSLVLRFLQESDDMLSCHGRKPFEKIID